MKKDVVVIGAGPAGSVAGVTLARKGHAVLCLESGYFPRHVIGESLLPRCNALLEQAGLLEAVAARRYMVKNGAVFLRGDERQRFCFAESLKDDHPSTFQMPRDDFDQVLATEARRAGLDLRFGQRVTGVELDRDGARVLASDVERETSYEVDTRFVLDCSGYGRVLARLLDLERPSTLPRRVSCYTHVENDLRPAADLEGDIWICAHPDNGWIWIIPFSNGRTSIGMVCDHDDWHGMSGTNRDRLFGFLRREPNAAARLAHAVPVAPTRRIGGYSTSVAAFHGERWALAGNASDFLDPVFSSGVTLALETAMLAAGLIDRTLSGETVRWEDEYDPVVNKALGVFLAFVESWYRRDLEAIFFSTRKLPRMKRRITSILGGHVLRDDNPLTTATDGALQQLYEAVTAQQSVAEA